MLIKSLTAREILDSRGIPTIEAELQSEQGFFRASSPSGVSAGKYEAVELRDGGKSFFGKGVQKAIQNIEKEIAPYVAGKNFSTQKDLDEFLISLDNTSNKSKLGANAILAVSMASCRALAKEQNVLLYQYIRDIFNFRRSNLGQFSKIPPGCFNVLEGGRHAGNDLDVQEFMIVPDLANFQANLQAASEIYDCLKLILVKNFGDRAINTGYESGFSAPLKKTKQALDFLMSAVKQAGYLEKVKIGLDIAASEIFRNGKYRIDGKIMKPEKLLAYYERICQEYPIIFLEDPFSQDDTAAWKAAISNDQFPIPKIFMIGDDLTATNPERIKMAHTQGLCNGVIIKLNQIGTVWEAITATELAQSFNWKVIVSHRAGETNDDFIADFACGLNADFIKAGAPAGGERLAKYNRLLEIENIIINGK